MKVLLLVLAVLCTALVAPVALVAGSTAALGDPVLVVAAPWHDGGARRVIEDSGAALVGVQQAPLASMTINEDPETIGRLRGNGAWLVLSAKNLSSFCSYLGIEQ